ncbi:hypothetical protein OG21DRAFT_1442125, partial [Imleria badia]
YTRVLDQRIIPLNSEHVAIALLEKRSPKYSDRPVFSTADLFDYEWPSSSAQYGFRLHRRLLHQVFHAKAALDYRDKQLQSAYELLTQLLDDQTRYAAHFTTCVSSYLTSGTCSPCGAHARAQVLSIRDGGDVRVRHEGRRDIRHVHATRDRHLFAWRYT